MISIGLFLSSMLFCPFSSASLSTTGSFFKNAKGAENDPELLTTVPEFFMCGPSNDCSHVVKQDGKIKQASAREEAEIRKRKDDVWKKMPQFRACKDIYDYGARRSGEYFITPRNSMRLKVYCDMENYGGGWTIVQRRVDSKTDFQRNWYDYKHGFGDLRGNIWIGLENMHILAGPEGGAVLQVKMKHLKYKNITYYANYCKFTIASEERGYELNVDGYWGNAGDGFSSQYGPRNNRMKFTTKDVDNDASASSNCASTYKGGWWYNYCHSCQLNALYPIGLNDGPIFMSWRSIDSRYGNIFFSEMKITRESSYFQAECAKLHAG